MTSFLHILVKIEYCTTQTSLSISETNMEECEWLKMQMN